MKNTKKRKNTGAITINDVADHAGVGAMTVSRFLREPSKVSVKLQEKIEDAIATLNYKPNAVASALASGLQNTLITVIGDSFCYSQSIFSKLQNKLIVLGYTVSFIDINGYPNKNTLIKSLIRTPPLLLIFINLEENLIHILEQELVSFPINYLFLGANGSQDLNNIEKQATYTLTEELIKKGYSEIALLCANQSSPTFKQRLSGWHKAMLANHLSADKVFNASNGTNFTSGSESLTDILLLWPGIELIMCLSDELACGLLNECHRKKIRIPLGISITGIGDHNCGRTAFPTLTTISVPYENVVNLWIEQILTKLDPNHLSTPINVIDYKKLIRWRNSSQNLK